MDRARGADTSADDERVFADVCALCNWILGRRRPLAEEAAREELKQVCVAIVGGEGPGDLRKRRERLRASSVIGGVPAAEAFVKIWPQATDLEDKGLERLFNAAYCLAIHLGIGNRLGVREWSRKREQQAARLVDRLRAAVAEALEIAAMPPNGSGVTEATAPATAVGQIDFTTERQRHVRFVGREDVLARLDEWLLGPGSAGWVVVTGGPGMGKSAILNAWLTRREAAGDTVPHHFIRHQVADWDQPEVIATSLATQIEIAFPELRDCEATPERRLIELLGRASAALGNSRRLVVLVDGLDEAWAEPVENPLPRFLPHLVPAGIRFLCATRRTYPHLNWLDARTSVRRLDLDEAEWAESNDEAVRGYWLAVADDYHPPLQPMLVAEAIARAEGNVLHAVMLHDAWLSVPTEKRRIELIPRGLRALIGEIWDRAADDVAVRSGLGLLCAAQEALSLDVLSEALAWSYRERRRFVPTARQLLLEESDTLAGVVTYRPRHDWVRELISESLGAAKLKEHHGTLVTHVATWPPIDAMRYQYAVRHALAHRVAIGDWSAVHSIALNLDYLEARCRAADVFIVEQELIDAASRCPDSAISRDLVDVTRALARESHWLRAEPSAAPSLVWNRLRRLGRAAEDLAARVAFSAGAPLWRVRHAAPRESHAHQRTLVGHTGKVTACTATNDCRWVVSASEDGTLKVWGFNDGRLHASLEGHADEVNACAVTRDAKRIVSGSKDCTLKVWDLHNGHLLHSLNGHKGPVTACAVTPDDRRVVSVSEEDHSIRIWDLDNGDLLGTLEYFGSLAWTSAVRSSGHRSMSVRRDHPYVWDLDSDNFLTTFVGQPSDAIRNALIIDGRLIIAVFDSGAFAIWDFYNFDDNRLTSSLEERLERARLYGVTANGRHVIATDGADQPLRLWDVDKGCFLGSFGRHAGAATAIVDAPNEQWVVSIAHRSLKLSSVSNVRLCAWLDDYADETTAWVVTADGSRVVSGCTDNTLKIWDLGNSSLSPALEGHTASVNACAVCPDGERVVSASHDLTIKVWDLHRAHVLISFEGHDRPIMACSITPGARRIVSASYGKELKIWDLENGRLLKILRGHTRAATSCAVTPDGQRIISGSFDGTLKIWDSGNGDLLASIGEPVSGLSACAVTPDGRRVVSAHYNNIINIWDLGSGLHLASLHGHTDTVRSCAVSPDGRLLVSASKDKTLKVWAIGTGRLVASLDGHSDVVTACAVTLDSKHVVSASWDRTLRIWSLETQNCVLVHRGDTAFQSVAVNADTVIAGDQAGTVWFLDLPPLVGFRIGAAGAGDRPAG